MFCSFWNVEIMRNDSGFLSQNDTDKSSRTWIHSYCSLLTINAAEEEAYTSDPRFREQSPVWGLQMKGRRVRQCVEEKGELEWKTTFPSYGFDE